MLSLKHIEKCIEVFDVAIKAAHKDLDFELRYGKSMYKRCKAIQKYGDLVDIRKEFKKQRRKAIASGTQAA